MHQDDSESSLSLERGLPVVSFSLGDACDFSFAPPPLERHESSESYPGEASVKLESGDALVFGGPARMCFHGVRKVHPGDRPPELGGEALGYSTPSRVALGMRPGRLNLTFRQF